MFLTSRLARASPPFWPLSSKGKKSRSGSFAGSFSGNDTARRENPPSDQATISMAPPSGRLAAAWRTRVVTTWRSICGSSSTSACAA
jgi:hypothetical protein